MAQPRPLNTLASLSTDGTVRLWTDAAADCVPAQVLDVRSLRPVSLSISPDDLTLAVCGTEAPAELWDLATAQRGSVMDGTDGAAGAVAYTRDGTLLIGTGLPVEHTLEDPEQAQVYELHPDGSLHEALAPAVEAVGHIAADASGNRIAITGRSERQATVWDRTNDTHQELPPATSALNQLAWSPDGSLLFGASPSDGVVAWDGSAWTTYEEP